MYEILTHVKINNDEYLWANPRGQERAKEMSILSFFKRKDRLPDPKGPLSAAIPSQAIVLANREVEKVNSEEASRRPNKCGKYHT